MGILLPLLQMAAPVPGVPLAHIPTTVVKPTKGARDNRWLVVWWQFSAVEGKMARKRRGFDLNSIPDRKAISFPI